MTDRMRWRAGAALSLMLAGALLTACTPQLTPTPSPTGFASEEEAFAAAEATYRAYVDAVNARNAGSTSSASPTDYLTGDALAGEIDSQQQFEESGIRLSGPISVATFTSFEFDPFNASGDVCLDVSGARVIDSSGADVTPTDRADRLGLALSFIWTPDAVLISESSPIDTAC